MSRAKIRWFQQQLFRHCGVFFAPRVVDTLADTPIRFLPMSEALQVTEPAIVVPIDLAVPCAFSDSREVSAYGADFRICHRITPPDSATWQPWPTADQPLWYISIKGARIPAWDMFGTLSSLMMLDYERSSELRDQHGRFVASFDPRAGHDLLEVPLFNIAAFVLAGESMRMAEGGDAVAMASEVRPPMLILSHDCDVLEGNDRYTQAIRLFRVAQPLVRARLPRLQNLWWTVRNAARPRDFYFDNCLGLITLERSFDYRSTFYLLNGTGGRFGARSGSRLLPALVDAIEPGWEVGMHYNYDTLLDDEAFGSQREELRDLLGRDVTVGRAHYLRLDPERSFAHWAANGITVDESLGYPDRIGYRAGVAGAFRPFDEETGDELPLTEIPMTVMENTLLRQYGDQAIPVFDRLLDQLQAIGGALSVIFHPGAFFNPEFPELRHLYHRMLLSGRAHGAEGVAAVTLDQRLKNVDLSRFNSLVAKT